MKPWREGVCPSLVSQDGTVTGQCFQGTGLTQNVIRTAFTQRNTHTILNTHTREHTHTRTQTYLLVVFTSHWQGYMDGQDRQAWGHVCPRSFDTTT